MYDANVNFIRERIIKWLPIYKYTIMTTNPRYVEEKYNYWYFLQNSGVKEAPIYRLSYAYYNSTYDNLGYNLDLSSLTTIGNYGLYYTFYGCNFVRGALNFDNLNSIGQYGLGSAFYSCPNINSVKFSKSDMSNGQYSLSYAFAYCSALSTVDMSKVITVGSNNYIFNYTFRGCTNLQTVDLSSLVYIYSYTFYYTFLDCTSLTSVDLSGLVTLYTSGRQQLYGIFSGCTSLTSFVFNSLARLTRNTLSYAFQNCTSLTSVSFPALTTNSFGSYTNQFSSMLVGCSNVTVHFPSNLEAVIGSWTDVINGFGGTGTTVLYGHNYRNSLLFSRNDELVNGDIVKVLDKEGNKVTYEIYGSQRTTSTDTSSYARTAEVTGGVCELVLSEPLELPNQTNNRLMFCRSKP